MGSSSLRGVTETSPQLFRFGFATGPEDDIKSDMQIRYRPQYWQDEGAATFTIEEAKTAGLAGKDNWKGYPSDMLFARALTRAQRRYAPDIWGGSVYTPEEVGADVDANGDVIDGSWRKVDDAPAAQIEAEKPVITLEMLVQKHGPAEILAANGGTLPATSEEIAELAVRLDGEREI